MSLTRRRRFGLGRLWTRITESVWTIPAVILLGVGGPRLYMNVRPADPLPYGFTEYTAEGLAAAQQGDGLVLVDVYASWCPTCLVQHKALDSLLRDPRYRAVSGVRVDFDRDHDFRERYRVGAQSTILVFAGTRELSRSTGVTRLDALRGQLDAALQADAARAP